MPDPALCALTWRITRRRLAASPLAAVAAAAFPALVVWIGLTDSYGTAAKFFFFLLPHVFLIAAQDTVRTDVESGALENVLFLGGRFRGYLMAKSFAVAAAAGAYAAALFALFAAWGLAAGGFEPVFALRFALALVAGLYYVALAGVLSYFLRAGSNVLIILLAQSAVVLGLIFSGGSAGRTPRLCGHGRLSRSRAQGPVRRPCRRPAQRHRIEPADPFRRRGPGRARPGASRPGPAHPAARDQELRGRL